MGHKTLINGTAYTVSGGKTLIGGTAYNIIGGKTLVNGTAYNINFESTMASLPVGTTFISDGYQYVVIHQGIPSNLYDGSCDGTWVMKKDVWSLSLGSWGSNNQYLTSQVHLWLERNPDSYYGNGGTIQGSGLCGHKIAKYIKQVKIPFVQGTGSSGTVAFGANGLSTHVFALSGYEVGFTKSISSDLPIDGAPLDYFKTNADRAIWNSNGGYGYYWTLRSPSIADNNRVAYVMDTGGLQFINASNSCYTRPAFILPSDLKLSALGL